MSRLLRDLALLLSWPPARQALLVAALWSGSLLIALAAGGELSVVLIAGTGLLAWGLVWLFGPM